MARTSIHVGLRVGLAATYIMTMVAAAHSEDVQALAQMREWTDITGKYRRVGIFVRLERRNNNNVLLRTPDGHLLRIPLHKLQGVDQEFVKAASGMEDSGDPFFERTLSFAAHGSGTTPENAKKDAVRNAVRDAVFRTVGEKTAIERNIEVIETRFLTPSHEFVSSVEVVADSLRRDGEIWTIRVKAEVRVEKLLELVEALGLRPEFSPPSEPARTAVDKDDMDSEFLK